MSTGTAAEAATTVTVEPSRLIERPCDTSVDATVKCYWLEAPERRDLRTPGRVRLWVAVMTPTNAAADAVPWVILSGGPGNAASTAWVAGTATFRPTPTPVIVMDQRGTGRSHPRLDCVHPRTVDDVLSTWTERLAALREAAAGCRRRLSERGIDLDGYDTAESAADFADLRALLGIAQWDIYGYSYGGRLALELTRQDPDGIRSLHLDSPLPTRAYGPADVVADSEALLTRTTAACALQPCGSAGPFDARLSKAFERLEADPYSVSPPGGSTTVFDGDQMLYAVRLAMHNTAVIPSVPGAVDAIVAGDFSFLDGIAGVLSGPPPPDPADAMAMGTFAVVVCADDPASTQRDQDVIASPGRWSSLIAIWPWHSCDIWDVDVSPAQPNTAHNIPTLVTVGELDIIPPERSMPGVQLASTNVQLVQLPAGGHIVARANDCILSISEAIRSSQTMPLNTACLLDVPPPFAP